MSEAERTPRIPEKMTSPITNFVKTVVIDFGGPMPSSGNGRRKFVLVCVDQLTNVYRFTNNATSEEVIKF